MRASFEDILRGQVLHVDAFPDKRRLLERFSELLHDSIRRICGPTTGAKIRATGFERMHQFVTPDQMIRIVERFTADLRAPALLNRLMSYVAFDLLNAPEEIWISSEFGLLIHPPQEYIWAKAPELERTTNPLVARYPHQDSWGTLNRCRINVWYALSRVRHDNGLVVFKDGFGKKWIADERGYLRTDQKVPRPHMYDMPTGEFLVFAGDHLHSSHLNVSDETRIIIGRGFKVERPGLGPWRPSSLFKWYRFGRSSAWANTKERIWQTLVRVLRPRISRKKRRVHAIENAVLAKVGGTVDLGPPADFKDGEARTVFAGGACLAVFRRGERFDVLGGLCPHAGGWLADGFWDGNTVTCPFHQLKFDVPSGKCTNLASRRAKKYSCWVESDRLWVRLD